MSDFQKEVMAWRVETFGPTGARIDKKILWKWVEETCELTRILSPLAHGYNAPDDDELKGKVADCLILLAAIAEIKGWDLERIGKAKFEIVKRRNQIERDRERGIE